VHYRVTTPNLFPLVALTTTMSNGVELDHPGSVATIQHLRDLATGGTFALYPGFIPTEWPSAFR
jgi:hypothetical protein